MIPPRGRILHLVTSNARRGAEIAARGLVDALVEAGIDGSLFALAPAHGDEADRLPIPTLGPSPRSPRTIRQVRGLARSHDLVIAHGSDTLQVAALATLGTATPFIYLMIGDPDVWGEVPFARLRIGLPLRRATSVVVLWPGAGRSIQDRYGISPERIEVIPNGRDPERFRPPTESERIAARTRFGLDADGAGGPTIAWIGALSEEKRPERAVEVVARIDGARLLMAGDGPHRPRVASRAAELGVDLHLLGVLSEVRDLLWAADLLLLTSQTEGMPGVAVEALLCETPVAAPMVGALPDLLGEDHPGLFPADASPTDVARSVEAVLTDLPSSPRPVTTAQALERWIHLLEHGPSGLPTEESG